MNNHKTRYSKHSRKLSSKHSSKHSRKHSSKHSRKHSSKHSHKHSRRRQSGGAYNYLSWMLPKSSTSNSNLVVADLKVNDLKFIIETIAKLNPRELTAFLNKKNATKFRTYINEITSTDNNLPVQTNDRASTVHTKEINLPGPTNATTPLASEEVVTQQGKNLTPPNLNERS